MTLTAAQADAEYQAAEQTAEAASSAPLNLPVYTGSATDLTYLKNYVLKGVESLYGISSSAAATLFATPTLESTALLRDFVHRAIYDNAAAPAGGQSAIPYEPLNDVGSFFRYPGRIACGGAAWQMYAVFEAFGYDATYIDTLGGAYNSVGGGTHVTTEVYCDDLGQSIIQDATYNLAVEDSSGNFLSYQQIQDNLAAGDPVTPVSFIVYTNACYGTVYQSIPLNGGWWNEILPCFSVLYGWSANNGQSLANEVNVSDQVANLFAAPATAHLTAQPGSFATQTSALQSLTPLQNSGLQNAGWIAAGDQIANGGNYVSGFEILSPDGTTVESEWLTVSLDNVNFISYNLLTGAILNGSFDQLEAEANDDGTPDLNHGADLSWIDDPFVLLEANGAIGASWNATFSISTPQLNYSTSTAAVIIDLGLDTVLSQSTGRYDPIGGVQSIIGSPYNDLIYVPIGDLATTTINGGAGSNSLFIEGAGSVDLANCTNIAAVYLDKTGANSLVVPNSVVASSLSIYGGPDGNTIDTSQVASGKVVYYYASGGADTFTSGADTNVIYLTSAEFTSDSLNFGKGTNVLVFSTSGTVNLSNVTGPVYSIYLGAGGANVLTLTNAAVAGIIYIAGGTGSDTIYAQSVSTGKAVSYVGGAENDTLYSTTLGFDSDVLTFGGGTNTVFLTTAGSVSLANASGVNYLYLGNGGANSITLAANQLSGFLAIVGGNDGNTVNASALTAGEMLYYNSGGGDRFTAGAENNTIYGTIAEIAGDTIAFGSGYSDIVFENAGTISLANVTGTIAAIYLGPGGANTLTINNAQVQGGIAIVGGSNDTVNTIYAQSLAAGKVLDYVGSTESDTFYLTTGGFASDALSLGSGTNVINFTNSGSVNLGTVVGYVASVYLGSGGADALTVTNAVVNGSIYISGGSGGDTIYAQAVSTGKVIQYAGGAENDTLYLTTLGFDSDVLTLGTGTNTVMLTTAGSVSLANASGVNYLYLGNGGANSITLAANQLTGFLAIVGGNGGNAVNASALTAGEMLYYNSSGGDTFTAGAENNTIYGTIAEIASDSITFGSGFNDIVFENSGTINLSTVTGPIAAIYLGSGGANTLTITSAQVQGDIGIVAGTGDTANLIYAQSLTAGQVFDYVGGAENDTLYLTAAGFYSDFLSLGTGTNTVVLTTAGLVSLADTSGINYLYLGNGGVNSITLAANQVTGFLAIVGGNDGNKVNASALTAGEMLYYNAGVGDDTLTAGAENNTVYGTIAEIASDSITFGSGFNDIVFENTGIINLSNVSGPLGAIYLASGGANTFTVMDALVRGSLSIYAGSGTGTTDTVTATSAVAGQTIYYSAGTGQDTFTGGAENDVANVPIAALGSDQFDFGSGTSTLDVEGSGSVNLTGVSGLDILHLDSTGLNTVTITAAETGTNPQIYGGNDGNDVTLSGFSSSQQVAYHTGTGSDQVTGGAEKDAFYVNGPATLTAGSGADQFIFAAQVQPATIASFNAAADDFVFSNAGFDLGVDNGKGTTTPQAIAASLFTSSSSNDAFTSSVQRFAYSMSTGNLYYSNNGTVAASVLVANLSNDPALTAQNILFVAHTA